MVVPGTPKLPQAICQGDGCPMAKGAMCNAYAKAVMAKTVTTMASEPATIMPNTMKAAAATGSAGKFFLS